MLFVSTDYNTLSMNRWALQRLCEPITTRWYSMPVERHFDDTGSFEWALRLFQVARDEKILLEWRNKSNHNVITIGPDKDALEESFELIRDSKDQQAFVVWKNEFPVVQIDVQNANNPLGEVCVPFDGAYAVLVKFPDKSEREDLKTSLLIATKYFFTFEEVVELYMPIADTLEEFITVALECGFGEVWINENKGRRLFALGRVPGRIVLDVPGP